MIFHSGLKGLLIPYRVNDAPLFHRSDPSLWPDSYITFEQYFNIVWLGWWKMSIFHQPNRLGLFGSRLGLLHLRDCKGASLWRKLCTWILWGNVLRSVIKRTESGSDVRSNIYRLHLDLVVKQLCYNTPFRNQKLCYGNFFLHKNHAP